MKISAKVLEDSVSAITGVRLITMELKYPRFVHAEFMTHRVFSRNASSSRAIPISKQIDAVENHPVFPSEWGSNKPGMQAGDQLSRSAQTEAEGVWNLAIRDAIKHARKLKEIGVHKQLANRLLEPFSYITVIVTATEWENFFNLRISPLAQPEIRILAERILAAQKGSTPKLVALGEMHAPYMTDEEREDLPRAHCFKVSAARCARVSYLNHDGLLPNIDKDMALADRLMADRHASVFEHQASPSTDHRFYQNFRSWVQFRTILGL